METVKNLFFQDHHNNQKLETVKNRLFQDHHILQIWKVLKISSFKTTTPTKSRNC